MTTNLKRRWTHSTILAKYGDHLQHARTKYAKPQRCVLCPNWTGDSGQYLVPFDATDERGVPVLCEFCLSALKASGHVGPPRDMHMGHQPQN